MSLDLAIRFAATNTEAKGLPRMGCIIVAKDGRRFGGRNKRKTHPLQAKWASHPDRIHIHAEIDALVQAGRMGYGPGSFTSASVARVGRRGDTRLAKPCTGCCSALRAFGITNIEWTV